MADVKEIKPYQRKKKRRSRFWRTLIFCIIVIAVFLFVAFSEGWINKDFLDQLLTKPQGYPVAVAGGKPRSILKSNKNIVLLTDTDLVYYNDDGVILSQTEHNCTNPYIITRNDKLLVYDKGYGFLQIQDKNGVIYSNSFSNRLINADLADNGSYAISTSSARFLSEMFVYNKNNTEICRWKSVGSYISSMSFSKNSKKLAVASIYAESGYFNSNIRIFDLNREEDPVVLDLNFNDSAIVEIQYLNSGKILIVFDNYYIVIDENGKTIEEYKFNTADELYYQNIHGNGGIIILKSADEKLIVNRFSSNDTDLNVQFALEEASFKSLTFSDKEIFILQDNKVYKYGNDGSKTVLMENIPDTFDICEKNGTLFLLNFTQIESYN